MLTLDGASQSLVMILARDGSGQVVANVTLRLQIRYAGTLQDFGQLSARTLVTGLDGKGESMSKNMARSRRAARPVDLWRCWRWRWRR